MQNVLRDLQAGLPVNVALDRRCEDIAKLESDFDAWLRKQAEGLAPKVDWGPMLPDESVTADSTEEKPAADPAETKPPAAPKNPLLDDNGVLNWPRLEAWLREHPNHFVGMMLQADAELKKKDWPAAEQTLKQLIEIYPGYNGRDNAYEKLAAVYQTMQRPRDERAVLEQFVQQTADGVSANLRLIELQSEADDWLAVHASAQRLLAVDPLLRNVHESAARAAEHLDQPTEVATALRRVAQLDPDDPAGVHLRLARALHSIGRNDEAKRHVLQALEEAPRYREAHRLLLKLVRGTSTSERGSAKASAETPTETQSMPAGPGGGTIEE